MRARWILTAMAGSVLALAVLGAATGSHADDGEGDPVDAAVWQAASPELRWVLFTRRIAEAPSSLAAWIAFLGRAGDAALLEQIAVHHAVSPALETLFRVEAPQRMRAAVWALHHPDSHTPDVATMQLQSEPGVFLAWLALHPPAKTDPAETLRAALAKETKLTPADEQVARGLLPPLDPDVVFRDLAAPPDLAVLRPGIPRPTTGRTSTR